MTVTKKSFTPLINKNSKILILGTLPGEDSLKFQQYYGHKRNQFWRLIGEIVGESLHDLPYEQKKDAILRHHLAIWDTLKMAKRQGSLDNNIHDIVHNNIPELLQQYPNIQCIGFNGKHSRKFFKQHESHLTKLKLINLPSSSPAYTVAFEKKLVLWETLFK
ncbi:MAG: DNA-deoxyinosine glycosylase [Ostreibacterium sp.]